MMLQVLGVLSLVAAIAAIIMHMRTSYVTQGGRQGQDPCVAAAAVQVPMMTMLGLALLNKTTAQFDLLWWQWLSIWLVEAIVVAVAAISIGDVAYRKSRIGRHDQQTLTKGG